MSILYSFENIFGNSLLNILIIIIAVWIVLLNLIKIFDYNKTHPKEIKVINLVFFVLSLWFFIRFILSISLF
ncbi:hypothetical protein BOQ28_11340 [Listeria monocytogenes]|nr:hypothetical protein [Listeria monocytogenes]